MGTSDPSKQELRCKERLNKKDEHDSILHGLRGLFARAATPINHMGILSGLHHGEKECFRPEANDANL